MSERNSRLMSIGEVAKSLHITRRMILNYSPMTMKIPLLFCFTYIIS